MPRVNIKPMSVNKAWRGGRRYKTNEYKAYEHEMLLKLPRMTTPDGKLGINIHAGFSNKGADVDNILKPLLDILQKKYDFNDSRIYRIHIEKQIVKKGDEFISFEIGGLD